jgi:cytochrome c5
MKSLKIFSLAALFVTLMMAGGCGGGGGGETPAAANPSVNAPIAATVNADGTATTGAIFTVVAAPAGTAGYLETVRVVLPPNTVISAKNADGTPKALTAPLSFTFTAPADSSADGSGINGVPAPTGFTTLASASGAVDVQLAGAASATFSNPVTITMPVPGKAVNEMVKVYTVTGTAYTLVGIFTVRPTGFVNFDVSSLSWKVGDPNPDPGASTTTPTTAATTTATTTVPPTTTVTTIATTIGTTTLLPTTTVPPTTIVTTTVPATTTTTVPSLDGAALFASTCQICHGLLNLPATGMKIPNTTTVADIRRLGMAFGLTDAQLLAIIAVLPP